MQTSQSGIEELKSCTGRALAREPRVRSEVAQHGMHMSTLTRAGRPPRLRRYKAIISVHATVAGAVACHSPHCHHMYSRRGRTRRRRTLFRSGGLSASQGSGAVAVHDPHVDILHCSPAGYLQSLTILYGPTLSKLLYQLHHVAHSIPSRSWAIGLECVWKRRWRPCSVCT